MLRIVLRFRECEHNGDLDMYARDVAKCGGVILDRMVDAMAEKGYLTVELDNTDEFYAKMKQTGSYSFLC